jgi:hypothetical protein
VIAFLNQSLLTASRTDRRRKPGQDAARFKKDEDSGKMVIDSDDDSDNDAVQPNGPPAEDVAGNAYKESLTSVDGFTRGPNGRIKFNKDTKKRRRENEDMEDIEMADVAPPLSAKKQKKKVDQPKLGHEFKAKASPFFELAYHIWFLTASKTYRKLEVISKRAAWILTRTFHSLRQLRRTAERMAGLVLPVSGEARQVYLNFVL